MGLQLNPNRNTVRVLVLVLLLVQVLDTNCEERSLFDDLPLNGAYSPSADGIKLVKPPQKPLDVKFAVRNNHGSKKRSSTSTTQIPIPTLEFGDDDDDGDTHQENSLFNELRNQGAMKSDEQVDQPSPHVSTTQKRSFESTSSGSRGFGGAVTNYFTSFFDSKKVEESTKATAPPTPVAFRVHSPPGAFPVITSSGVRVPLIVRNRGNETNVYDANVSPQHQHYAIPVLTREISTPPKGDPAPVRGSHVYSTPLYSTPEHKSQTRDYDASHHYFPSKTKVQSYPVSRQQQQPQHYVYSKEPDIVYGTSPGQVQRALPGYTYPPPTTTSTTTTLAPPPLTRPPRPRPTPTQQPFPVVTGNPAHVNLPSAQITYPDYDYETLDDKPASFGARTGSFSVTLDGGIGLSHSKTATRYDPASSYTASTGWSEPELKPVHIPPPASYGPPPSYEPSATYGPPPPPQEVHPPAPPPPPPAPASPPATATTSISYQTIPIQTVHTQLVTVPHITISSSSAVESELSQDTPVQPAQRPARPPSSGGYGPSSYDAGTNHQVTKKSGSLFTDDQIAALLAFNHGLGDSSVYASRESDALSLLTAQQGLGSSRGNGLQSLGFGLGLDEDLRGLGLGATDNLRGLGLGVGDSLQLQAPLPNINPGRPTGLRLPSLFRQQRPNPPAQHPLRLNPLRNNNNGLYKRNVAELLARQRYADSFGTLPNQPLLLDANRYGTGAGGTILTKDAIQAVNELVQEQRLRGAVSDLRTRLEYEGRSAARARENYRSLFYKGALLLSALTLIPTLASPIASATVAQQAIAAASPLGHLLPLASGRRKREIDSDEGNHHSSLKFEDCTPILQNSSFGSWLKCAENATVQMFQNSTEEAELNSTASLFDSLAFNGAFVPESIRANLIKYLPAEEIKRNSECIQKRFCETLKQIETLPRDEAESILFIYSIFAGDIDSNPWIREAMTGGRNNKCEAFYCFEDYPSKFTDGETASKQ